MVSLSSLWVPILASTVVVFIVSAILHMVLPFHRKDFVAVPNEADVMDAVRRAGVPPGDYMFPHGGGPEAMKDPAFIEKMTRGPIAVMTVMPSGPPTMGVALGQWFVYCLVVTLFAAYVAAFTLPAGTPYMTVFCVVCTVAFVGYTLAGWQNSIWYKRAWRTTILNTVDGLIYALLTAGFFGWLWPKG